MSPKCFLLILFLGKYCGEWVVEKITVEIINIIKTIPRQLLYLNKHVLQFPCCLVVSVF